MSRQTDSKDIIERIDECIVHHHVDHPYSCILLKECKEEINQLRQNFSNIVHCKDCKHSDKSPLGAGWIDCKKMDIYIQDDSFCSHGQHKGE